MPSPSGRFSVAQPFSTSSSGPALTIFFLYQVVNRSNCELVDGEFTSLRPVFLFPFMNVDADRLGFYIKILTDGFGDIPDEPPLLFDRSSLIRLDHNQWHFVPPVCMSVMGTVIDTVYCVRREHTGRLRACQEDSWTGQSNRDDGCRSEEYEKNQVWDVKVPDNVPHSQGMVRAANTPTKEPELHQIGNNAKIVDVRYEYCRSRIRKVTVISTRIKESARQ
jgi:hypothetical protein